MSERDGFIVFDRSTGREVHFIPCEKDGRMREKVEDGLLMRVDVERFYFRDTRPEGTYALDDDDRAALAAVASDPRVEQEEATVGPL